MKAIVEYNSRKIEVDISNPLDISIPIDMSKKNINAWYVEDPKIFPESFDGEKIKVSEGAVVNFNNIHFNPHSHITHTECVGHISKEAIYMTELEVEPYLSCFLVNAKAESLPNGDRVVNLGSFNWDEIPNCDAVIIHSGTTNKAEFFSGNNPCYIDKEVMAILVNKGINHVLTDLPSVDREDDGGALAAHKAFFKYPEIHLNRTITELIHVPNSVKNGEYVLSISFAPMETRAPTRTSSP